MGQRGAGRGWDAGTRRAAECALLAESGKSRIQAAPFLSPSSLPSSLPLLPPPSLDVGCRLSPRGTGREPRSPRGRRGCAQGSCPAAQRRAPGSGGAHGRKRQTPASNSAVGPRERAAEGGKVRSSELPWWQCGDRVGELAWLCSRTWREASRRQALCQCDHR